MKISGPSEGVCPLMWYKRKQHIATEVFDTGVNMSTYIATYKNSNHLHWEYMILLHKH